MSTSVTDNKKYLMKTALVYTSIAVFCAFFGAIYEIYGHGVYSYYMLYAFAYPLVGGAFPPVIAMNLNNPKIPNTKSRYFYHSAIATLTAGSIFNGVLKIYGTTSKLYTVYLIAAAILLILSLIFFFIGKESEEEKDIIPEIIEE